MKQIFILQNKIISAILISVAALMMLSAAMDVSAKGMEINVKTDEMNKIYETASQIVIVSGETKGAGILFLYEKENGEWKQVMTCPVYTGRDGFGKTREGDNLTPIGVFGLNTAFGIAVNPGCKLPYTQIDDSYWWVSDSKSDMYNRFVSTNQVPCTWDKSQGEHLIEMTNSYKYVLNMDYNPQNIPGGGSALFVHCENGKPTAGCVALPEENMKTLMCRVMEGCLIYIDLKENIVFPK